MTELTVEPISNETPSGIVVKYRPDPRQYWVNDVEVPSVTTVLDILHKSALPYWGNKIGAEGVLELVRRGFLEWRDQ